MSLFHRTDDLADHITVDHMKRKLSQLIVFNYVFVS